MADISLSAAVDTSGVAAGMAAIENQVSRSASSIGQTLRSYLTAGVIIAEFQKIAMEAENVHREAARFRIDAEQLQIVTNAAKQLGLPMEQVARAMNLLEINAQKALNPTTKQALAMEGLNISAKEFAQLDVVSKFYALSDAAAAGAKDGKAYADVAQLIGVRNTEMIPLIYQGSQAIIDQGKAFRVMSNDEIATFHALKVEQDKYIQNLQGVLARIVVGWGRYFTTLKSEFQSFKDWVTNAAIFSIPMIGPVLTASRPAAGVMFNSPQPTPASTPTPAPVASGEAAAVGITDISAGSGAGLPSGRGGVSAIEEATLTRTLNLSDRLNELLSQRVDLQNKLDEAMAAGDAKAATQYQLQVQIAKIDQQILPLQQQIALEEQKGVDAADRQIQKSANRVEIDQLDLQISDLRNKGNEYGAFLLESQRNLLQINLDFDEKIQAAIDKADEARAKGLELTAQENELLAQQLAAERQVTLEQEQQRQAQERQRIAQGPNPLTISALAEGNLRLGATSDVYAAALAASRGLKPGSPEYNRLVQQTNAQDQLRQLQGRNLGWEEQLGRDKLVQWYSGQQQQQATGAAQQSHQEEIAYWQAIATGRTPSGDNPYLGVFGVPNFQTGQFTSASSATPNPALDKLQSQIDLQQQSLTALQQIVYNTTMVHV